MIRVQLFLQPERVSHIRTPMLNFSFSPTKNMQTVDSGCHGNQGVTGSATHVH